MSVIAVIPVLLPLPVSISCCPVRIYTHEEYDTGTGLHRCKGVDAEKDRDRFADPIQDEHKKTFD